MRDSELTTLQKKQVAKLTDDDLELIDSKVLSECSNKHYRKVAKVVGFALKKCMDKYPELPDVFYPSRVRSLVERGLLESTGDLYRIRHSEVRLHKNKT